MFGDLYSLICAKPSKILAQNNTESLQDLLIYNNNLHLPEMGVDCCTSDKGPAYKGGQELINKVRLPKAFVKNKSDPKVRKKKSFDIKIFLETHNLIRIFSGNESKFSEAYLFKKGEQTASSMCKSLSDPHLKAHGGQADILLHHVKVKDTQKANAVLHKLASLNNTDFFRNH